MIDLPKYGIREVDFRFCSGLVRPVVCTRTIQEFRFERDDERFPRYPVIPMPALTLAERSGTSLPLGKDDRQGNQENKWTGSIFIQIRHNPKNVPLSRSGIQGFYSISRKFRTFHRRCSNEMLHKYTYMIGIILRSGTEPVRKHVFIQIFGSLNCGINYHCVK